MPLHLLAGFMTSDTPSASLQRRRTSPGMSLKSRNPPAAFQIGPSVNLNPVASRSTTALSSTSSSSASDFTTVMPSPLGPLWPGDYPARTRIRGRALLT